MSIPFKTLSPSVVRVPEQDYYPALVNPLYLPDGSSMINAGPDQSLLDVLVAQLAGSSSNSAMTYLWTLVSGPGTATFSDATSLTPTVTVSVIGNYVFRLTGTLSYWTTSDDVGVAFAENLTADIIIAGGGGGSGGYYGGGGAGGEVVEILNLIIPLPLPTITVTVGNGGLAGTAITRAGGDGQASVFSGPTVFTAAGGAGGGGGYSAGNATGRSGVNGGGGAGIPSLSPGGIGTAFSGGLGRYDGGDHAAGGGGAGANEIGAPASANAYIGGKGGDGKLCWDANYYGGGGGGSGAKVGNGGVGGVGGLGGGGNGSNVEPIAGSPGTANTGGGGGGGCREAVGALGGSGIVKVRILTSKDTFTGGTITYDGSYTIHTFTTSGTLQPA